MILTTHFEIPPSRIINANSHMSALSAASRASWIRAYSEPVWTRNIEQQFGKIRQIPEISSILPQFFDSARSLEKLFEEAVTNPEKMAEYCSTLKKFRKTVERCKKRQTISEIQQANTPLFATCSVRVTVHNISRRTFDAPNFAPTVKAILDGGTDCGILWKDDNNSIITGGVLFTGGDMKFKDRYVFDIEVEGES